MKKIFTFVLLSLSFQAVAGAQGKHEVRLGFGDMFFETMVWHNQVHRDYSGCDAGAVFSENTRYTYSPHISGEYAYQVLPWMSVGAILDFQMTGWTREWYNTHNALLHSSKENFFNLCILPTVRFNYFRREYVEIYSSISVGMDINGGTEKDGFGRNTVCGAALDLRPVGVKAGHGHWWGFFEIGGLYALKSTQTMFMLNSQIIKAGATYKF